MKGAGFVLRKWHSDSPSVESTNKLQECETTYAKTLVGNLSVSKTKLPGLPWEKTTDVTRVNFESCIEVEKPITR